MAVDMRRIMTPLLASTLTLGILPSVAVGQGARYRVDYYVQNPTEKDLRFYISYDDTRTWKTYLVKRRSTIKLWYEGPTAHIRLLSREATGKHEKTYLVSRDPWVTYRLFWDKGILDAEMVRPAQR